MSAFKKVAGLVAGVSAVAIVSVAIAQGQPPNPLITNAAIGAGSQTTTRTLIGETGQLPEVGYVVQTATLQKEADVAVVAPAPEPVAAAQPAPDTVAMGAPPAPVEQPAAPAPRRDRG